MTDFHVQLHDSDTHSQPEDTGDSHFIKFAIFGFLALLFICLVVIGLLWWKYGNPLPGSSSYSQPLTLAQFKEKTESSPTVTIIDIRAPDEYERDHIREALNFPVGKIDYFIRVATAKEVLIYADSQTLVLAKDVADEIGKARSDIKTYYLSDKTFDDWKNEGYPTALIDIKTKDYYESQQNTKNPTHNPEVNSQ